MLTSHLRAGIPALCLKTHEAERAQRLIALTDTSKRFLAWDCLRGVTDAATGAVCETLTSPMQVFQYLCEQQGTVLVAHGLHRFLDKQAIIQAVMNSLDRLSRLGSGLVMLMPQGRLPPELERVVPVIELPLPDETELRALQAGLDEAAHGKAEPLSWQLAMGLTEAEARSAFAASLAATGGFSGSIIGGFKDQLLRKTGLLELCEPADPGDVVGYGGLGDYIKRRAVALTGARPDLPRIKAILLTGVPGSGKSLFCRVVAAMLGRQLIRLDLNSLLCFPAGEALARLREVTRILEAGGPAVLWLDDMDLCFAQDRSTGAVAATFARFMTWMGETHAPLLVMASVSRVSNLPLKFVRAGYWDMACALDLPDQDIRKDIIEVMNRRYGTNIPRELSGELEGFSGAEIEQLARDSLSVGLESAVADRVPLASALADEFKAAFD